MILKEPTIRKMFGTAQHFLDYYDLYVKFLTTNKIKPRSIDLGISQDMLGALTVFHKSNTKIRLLGGRFISKRKFIRMVVTLKKTRSVAGKAAQKAKKRASGKLTADYIVYIASEQWKAKREEFFAFLESSGLRIACQDCGSNDLLQVHHLHYRNLFREKMCDLRLLCKECHSKVHAVKKTF